MVTPADLVHDWSAGTFTCPLCREVLHGRDRTDLCPTRVTRALATARAEADADGYARGRADGLREAAEIAGTTAEERDAPVAENIGAEIVRRRIKQRIRDLAPHPEPTPGPLTNCDNCANDYLIDGRRMCRRVDAMWANFRTEREAADELDEWVAGNTNEDGAPLPGATGCPGHSPKATPGPRVGDVVTPANVGALPVGTVVRWEWREEEWTAERVEADLWLAGTRGVRIIEHDDDEISGAGGPVTTIASLPRAGGGGS